MNPILSKFIGGADGSKADGGSANGGSADGGSGGVAGVDDGLGEVIAPPPPVPVAETLAPGVNSALNKLGGRPGQHLDGAFDTVSNYFR